MTTLLLIHGGLWEDMDAHRFWHRPDITAGLRGRGIDVLAPDRPRQAPSWTAEVGHITAALPDRPVAVLAGSNGCSVAVRLALAHPERVERLLLAWPATATTGERAQRTRDRLTGQGATPQIADALLLGQTLRGVSDAELATIACPAGVLPSVPENPAHQRQTVDALLRILPHATELPGCPEPPLAAFAAHAEQFIETVTRFVEAAS